jgi:hypothetical protein
MWANDLALGRNWQTADSAALVDFGDVCRVDLFWKDGAQAYVLEDTRDEAITTLNRLGWQLSGPAIAA